MGKTKTECSDEIGVDRKSINRYLAGERYPDREEEDKIRTWIEGIKAAAKGVAPSRPKPGPSRPQIESAQAQAESGGTPEELKPPRLYNNMVSQLSTQLKCPPCPPACGRCPLNGRPRVEGRGVESTAHVARVRVAPAPSRPSHICANNC